jgi:rhodanese-related sulfurtransferase
MTAWIAGAVVLAMIALGAIYLLERGATAQPLPPEISVIEAAAKRDAGAFILDVREPSEWTAAHVSGATLIPLGQLTTRLGEVPKDKDIVVMCRTGHRSAQGRDILLQAGYSRVTSVAGGLTAWSAQGLPTMSGQ